MSISVALHRPTRAWATEFESQGRQWGCVTLSDEAGHKMEIYTEPHVARAVADAFTAAMAPADQEVAA